MVLTAVLVVAALIALYLTLFVGPAAAKSGGIGVNGTATGTTGKPGKAKLTKKGKAIPPSNAPKRVVKVIEAANKIRRKPYKCHLSAGGELRRGGVAVFRPACAGRPGRGGAAPSRAPGIFATRR